MTDTTKAPPDTRTSQQIEDDLIVTRARLAGRLDDLQAYVAPRAVLGHQLEQVRSFYVDELAVCARAHRGDGRRRRRARRAAHPARALAALTRRPRTLAP